MASVQTNAPFVLVEGQGWHSGVVGIVAGRLKDRFNKPALVAGFEGGMGRGSARSIPGIDIGAIVRAAHEAGLLQSGGGHAMAAGFSLSADKLDAWAPSSKRVSTAMARRSTKRERTHPRSRRLARGRDTGFRHRHVPHRPLRRGQSRAAAGGPRPARGLRRRRGQGTCPPEAGGRRRVQAGRHRLPRGLRPPGRGPDGRPRQAGSMPQAACGSTSGTAGFACNSWWKTRPRRAPEPSLAKRGTARYSRPLKMRPSSIG